MKMEDFHNEITKEIEFSNEKEKLKEVVDIINSEVLNLIQRRKEISKYILEYRKKAIEEYKDDEDKMLEYFDHEKFVQEEAYNSIDRRLKELNLLKPSPYFGRVDFKEDGLSKEEIYIGRFGLISDETSTPIVIDWRAPIASIFYSNSLGKSSYKSLDGNVELDILLKRQFLIKNQKLKGFFDSALDVKDDILQMVLSKNSTDKLKDIVMTIQEEQNNIIRQPHTGITVVDGVAGSGKTTIALHRVAYLLYNFRSNLENKVLILGPNNIFMDYISTVLPTLGEIGVKQKTFRDFALNLLNLDSVMSLSDYMEKILSGDKEFINSVVLKNSKEFINKLDEFVEYLNDNYFKARDIKLRDKIVVSSEEISEMLNKDFKYMPLFRRSKKIKRIIFSRLKDERDVLVRKIQKQYKDTISNMTSEQLNVNANNLEFNRRIKIRSVIKDMMDVKKSLNWLDGENIIKMYIENINGTDQLTYDDLAPIMYLKIKLEGLKINYEVKHIVIDEAQDYSLLQFKVIKELTNCTGFTILGDSNQRIIPIKEEIPMKNLSSVINGMKINSFDLIKSYRTTKQIMEYASNILDLNIEIPLIREGKEVTEEFFSSNEELISSINKNIMHIRDKGYESIGIICRDIKLTKKYSQILREKKGITFIYDEDMIYNSKDVIMPSYLAKGLEFDVVFVIQENEDLDIPYLREDKINYIMATRALHELYIYTKIKK